jgi:cytidyltransferase-like protein
MKKAIKKIAGKDERIVVAVSGGFDPVHIGHVRMFNDAKKLGDELVVILNNDNWLHAKKGYVFMPEHERKEVIGAFAAVDRVIISSHPEDPSDMSVCDELRLLRPHIFANGGDRTNKNVPEIPVCEEIGCQMIYNVGQGGKIQSSSWLLGKASGHKKAKRR